MGRIKELEKILNKNDEQRKKLINKNYTNRHFVLTQIIDRKAIVKKSESILNMFQGKTDIFFLQIRQASNSLVKNVFRKFQATFLGYMYGRTLLFFSISFKNFSTLGYPRITFLEKCNESFDFFRFQLTVRTMIIRSYFYLLSI